MKKIHKKVWPEYFESILDLKKNFELRLNDFECNEGDTLILEEWDPDKKKYTGRSMERKITYVLKFKPDEIPFWKKEEIKKHGLQIISLDKGNWISRG